VCYYRDKNSINKFQLAKVTAEGVTISGAQAWGRGARKTPVCMSAAAIFIAAHMRPCLLSLAYKALALLGRRSRPTPPFCSDNVCVG
jgi:hypothetical protein